MAVRVLRRRGGEGDRRPPGSRRRPCVVRRRSAPTPARLKPGCLFVALKGENFDAHDFLVQARRRAARRAWWCRRAASTTMPSPERRRLRGGRHPGRAGRAGAASPHALQDARSGAVTGSNGKTTTKELIGAILETRGPALKTQGNLNNEVGVPLTLFEPRARGTWRRVVELGMNHPGEIARLTAIARPTPALITVVQPAHLRGPGQHRGRGAGEGRAVQRARARRHRGGEPRRRAHRGPGRAPPPGAKQLTFGRAAGRPTCASPASSRTAARASPSPCTTPARTGRSRST